MKCLQFVGLYCSNYAIMHGMEIVKFVNIYQDYQIRVLFLTQPGVSMTTPANVVRGSVIFAQARTVAKTSFLDGFSKIAALTFIIQVFWLRLVSLGEWLPKFRRIAAPSSPKTKQSQKILRFVLDCLALKYRGTTIIRNVRTHPHKATVAYARRPESWAIPHCQNPNKVCCKDRFLPLATKHEYYLPWLYCNNLEFIYGALHVYGNRRVAERNHKTSLTE